MSRTLFKYEPFSIVIQTADQITNVTSTNLRPYVTLVDPSAVIIQGTNGYVGAPSSNESVVIDVSGGTQISNAFVLNPGRFFDASAQSFNNRIFTFFKNETITPILFDSCINLASIQSVPTLPPGLGFVSNTPSSFYLQGTPTVQIPTSNYLIIGTGTNPSQIVTTRVFGTTVANGGINVGVNAERIQTNISGSTIVSPMIVDTPIDTRVLTSIVPSPSGANVQYSWNNLPSGLQFSNKDGTPFYGNSATILGSFDPSFTLVLDGTPTLTTAKSFAAADITEYTVSVQSFRTSPLPILSNTSNAFTFRFEPMVLFDDFVIPTLYKNATLNPTQYFFRARTYFTTDASITSISATGLPPGLSLNFVSNEQRAYLTGTPTGSSTFSGFLYASNSNGVVGSNPITINVSDDIVFFEPPTATSDVSFIVSRPLNLFKSGYYTSNVQFKARAGSGCNITYSVSGLEGTGIETSVSSNILTLTGVPSTAVSTRPLIVTATSSATATSNTTTIQFQVVNDVIDFSSVSLSARQFVQNREIAPIQIIATTLSERPITSFSGSNFPNSISISPTGVISGRMDEGTDGSLNIVASTGYVSASYDLSYSVVPDSVLLVSPVSQLSLVPSSNIGPVLIKGLAYSGRTVSNYQFSNLSPTYGLTIGSTSGILNGTLTQGFPPQDILPATSNFLIKAFAGDVSQTISMNLSTSNTFRYRGFITHQIISNSGAGGNSTIYHSDDISNWTSNQTIGSMTTFVNTEYTNPFSNQITYLSSDFSGSFTHQYTTGPDFQKYSDISLANANEGPGQIFAIQQYPLPMMTSIAVDGSTWWGIGGRVLLRDVRSNTFGCNEIVRWFAGDIVKSTDQGHTWSNHIALPTDPSGSFYFFARDYINPSSSNSVSYGDYYNNCGTAIAYKNGVMLIGGLKRDRKALLGGSFPTSNFGTTTAMLRSTDDGTTWSKPSNAIETEVGSFCVDNSSVWVVAGSDLYQSGSSFPSTNANTLKYSTDQGATWSNATGDFDIIGYHVTYGNNKWLATGADGNFTVTPSFRYSTNGSNWTSFDLSTSPLFNLQSNVLGPRTSEFFCNENYWYIFVYRYTSNADIPSVEYLPTLYYHDTSTSLLSNWIGVDLSDQFPITTNPRENVFYGGVPNNLISLGTPPNQPCTLTFGTSIGNGPTFTSPTSADFIFYQYLPISPIQLQATGTGQIYYFVETADLPRGLSFDPITAKITGTPVVIGENDITVYARDDNGTSVLVLRTTTIIPRILKQQTSAGAYTSLVRQYTEVNAAQNSINNLVYPNQEQKLGEFAAPDAPDTTKQPFDPCCTPTHRPQG